MSNLISTLGTYTQNTDSISAGQAALSQLTAQLNTNQQSPDLVGYGSDAGKIIDLKSTIAENQAYTNNSNQVSTFLSSYDLTLNQLNTDAKQLSTSLASFNANDTNAISNLQNLIKGLQVDTTATLNTETGNRYLFGGSRYTTQPVTDLTTLPVPTTPTPFAAATAAGTAITGPPASTVYAPNYDTQAATLNALTAPLTATQQQQVNSIYASQTVNLSDQTKLTYGVTSNDPAIQQLVYAYQQAQGGAVASEPQRTQFFDNAKSALTQALSGLQALQDQNSENTTIVTNEQAVQSQTVTNLQNQLDSLTTVNTAEVATKLSAVQTQLEATYKVTASLLNLSLLNYLK